MTVKKWNACFTILLLGACQTRLREGEIAGRVAAESSLQPGRYENSRGQSLEFDGSKLVFSHSVKSHDATARGQLVRSGTSAGEIEWRLDEGIAQPHLLCGYFFLKESDQNFHVTWARPQKLNSGCNYRLQAEGLFKKIDSSGAGSRDGRYQNGQGVNLDVVQDKVSIFLKSENGSLRPLTAVLSNCPAGTHFLGCTLKDTEEDRDLLNHCGSLMLGAPESRSAAFRLEFRAASPMPQVCLRGAIPIPLQEFTQDYTLTKR